MIKADKIITDNSHERLKKLCTLLREADRAVIKDLIQEEKNDCDKSREKTGT